MEGKLFSQGKCVFCEQKYTQETIAEHLKKHLTEIETKRIFNLGVKKYWHIEVEAAEMFLHLLVSGAAKMQVIDQALRAIWLDCCGHMSQFSVNGKAVAMSRKVESVFSSAKVIEHEYDFGSTTTVELKAHKQYTMLFQESVILLSRNEPLKIMCHICGQAPATNICSVCIYEGKCLFCDKCAKKHKKTCEDFADYAKMPVVNSPRMGICAYEGGMVDLERDGVYK